MSETKNFRTHDRYYLVYRYVQVNINKYKTLNQNLYLVFLSSTGTSIFYTINLFKYQNSGILILIHNNWYVSFIITNLLKLKILNPILRNSVCYKRIKMIEYPEWIESFEVSWSIHFKTVNLSEKTYNLIRLIFS